MVRPILYVKKLHFLLSFHFFIVVRRLSNSGDVERKRSNRCTIGTLLEPTLYDWYLDPPFFLNFVGVVGFAVPWFVLKLSRNFSCGKFHSPCSFSSLLSWKTVLQ
jgi:hypothetical protein